MANWSLPSLTDTYTNILTYLKGRDDNAVSLNDSRASAATNLPDYAKKWDNTNKKFQSYLSAAWSDLVLSVAGGGTGAATVGDARTNLSVYSKAESDAAYETPSGATTKVSTHSALESGIHGATATPAASKIPIADGSGRLDGWITKGNYAIVVVLDGMGAAIPTGVRGDVEVPVAGTILRATLLPDVSGSIVIDLWKDTYANHPPTDADSITASAPPTISSGTKYQDATLTGWSKTLVAGDILRFNVDSCTTISRCVVSILVERT